jgi:hypothetical protein
MNPRVKVSGPQQKLYKIIRRITKSPTVQEVTFDFFPYARYDIVVPEKKMIVEYDGEQHFKFIKHFHKTKEGYEKYKDKSQQKQEVAENMGWDVKRFSYVEKIDDEDYIRKVLPLK